MDLYVCMLTRNVLFQCEKSGVVASIHKGSCKDSQVMHLLRTLKFFTAYYDIEIMAEHIPGVTDTTADYLSRNNTYVNVFLFEPTGSPPTDPLPLPLLAMLTPPWEDWTFSNFKSHIYQWFSPLNQEIIPRRTVPLPSILPTTQGNTHPYLREGIADVYRPLWQEGNSPHYY